MTHYSVHVEYVPQVPGLPGVPAFSREMPSHTPESELRNAAYWTRTPEAEVKPTTAAGGGLRSNTGLAARKWPWDVGWMLDELQPDSAPRSP